MTNIWIICRKELKSYFASPIAYLLMAFFGLIFGFGFFTATRDFVRFSFQAQMMGRQMPMNVNEQVIRPLLGFASTVALFLIPMITMRLFALEKFSGTFETLMTAPVSDFQVVLAKFSAALLFYVVMWLPLLGCLLTVRHYSSDLTAFDAGSIGSTWAA